MYIGHAGTRRAKCDSMRTARCCPQCSSTATIVEVGARGGLPGVQRCCTCAYSWSPCLDCAGGYVLRPRARGGPEICGCKRCDEARGGVRDEVARTWPGAWRAMAKLLDKRRPETETLKQRAARLLEEATRIEPDPTAQLETQFAAARGTREIKSDR